MLRSLAQPAKNVADVVGELYRHVSVCERAENNSLRLCLSGSRNKRKSRKQHSKGSENKSGL